MADISLGTTSGNKPPGTLETPPQNRDKKKLSLTELYKRNDIMRNK